jgi:hypothetical protein
MTRELKIDRAIYFVDVKTKTYRYLRRNPEWVSLPPEENEANKRAIDGYMRVFRDGQIKPYRRVEHLWGPTTPSTRKCKSAASLCFFTPVMAAVSPKLPFPLDKVLIPHIVL